MTLVKKWVFVLVSEAVTVITTELIRIPEDEKLTEITSAVPLMDVYNSVIVWKNMYRNTSAILLTVEM